MNKLSAMSIGLLLVPSAYAQNNTMLSAASQFNPSISLILDGNYYHDNKKGAATVLIEEMAGIGHSVGFGAEEAGLRNGFNLGESESFKDVGVQMTWLAPTTFYALFGLEALQGNDQERFGTQISNEDAKTVIDVNQPFSATQSGSRLNTLFAKFAPDIGAEQALQIGVSYAQAQHYQQLLNDDDIALNGDEYALDGKQQLYGLDWVYKWDSAGEFGQGDIKITGEYLRLKKDMRVVASGNAASVVLGDKVTGTQDGYYLQASYGIAPRWKLAARYDVNGVNNELDVADTNTQFKQSSRQSISLAFVPSEFSRLRLQLGQGSIYDNSDNKTSLKQVFLQYTHSLGQHGAHKF